MPVEVLPEMTIIWPKKEDRRVNMSLIEKFKRWADKCGWFLFEEKDIDNIRVLKYILPDGADKTIRIEK